ncbi:hypothetical protein KPL74_10810 [Bacillus sp. NP157]|nr:hypothetical protein KPL74_10810 [Bacillus sp. NP157]
MTHTSKFLLLAAIALALPATPALAAPAATMCGAGDKPVLSCPLASGGKTVSVCAAANNRFYYAYGKPGAKADMTWPADGANADGLTRTHLGFAGNNGGYAFAFTNAGFKYVVYATSGSRGAQDGGIIVLHGDDAKPVKNTRCQAGAITESDDDALLDATLKLPKDPTIQQHGLPPH